MLGKWKEKNSSNCLDRWINENTGEVLEVNKDDSGLFGIGKDGYAVYLRISEDANTYEEKWRFRKKGRVRKFTKDLMKDCPRGLKDTGRFFTFTETEEEKNSVLRNF